MESGLKIENGWSRRGYGGGGYGGGRGGQQAPQQSQSDAWSQQGGLDTSGWSDGAGGGDQSEPPF